jgi:OOP family OmpA-OmpF porin
MVRIMAGSRTAPQESALAYHVVVDVAEPGLSIVFDKTAERMEEEVGGALAGHPIDFVPGTTTLSADSSVSLKKVASILKKYPDARVCVHGHTACEPAHEAGSMCNLQPLSSTRADSVMQMLRSEGVMSTIVARGWGCLHPVVKVRGNCRVVHQVL